MYDAIVAGARCAGSPTAMLLARKGYRVLLLDRATFPSDTISTHIVWQPGAARLQSWGLLEAVLASNCPPMRQVSFDLGPFTLIGTPPPVAGVATSLAPRRTVLDSILVNAAVQAGAELRENCPVLDVVSEADRVTGVRCRTNSGSEVTEKARIVIGADGRNSVIARSVRAQEYNSIPALAFWYYTYWSGVTSAGFQMYARPDRAIGAVPTNDGLVLITLAGPAREFQSFRADIAGNYLKSLALVPELAEQVRQGRQEDRFYGMADLPFFFRRSSGPGWALVGDAGYHKDPITAQGISDAFDAAELLADAVHAGLSGVAPMATALSHYEQSRDQAVMPMYEMTRDWATLAPPTDEMQQLFAALHASPADTDRFFGTLAGTVPIPEFYSPENLQRITGALAAQ